jgi:uncharacterized coiled-coil DUF342 family protein
MRNIAALLLLLALLAACGGSEAKAAFERYDKAVEPVLEEEAELLARYDDMLRDGKGDTVRAMIEDKLVPFYLNMAERVAAISPGDEALTSIHSELVAYVGQRQEHLRVLGKLHVKASEMEVKAKAVRAKAEEAQKREEPAVEKVEEARRAFSTKVQALNTVLQASPDLVEQVIPLFRRSDQMVNGLFGRIDALRQGRLSAAEMLRFLSEQASPFLESVQKDIDELDLGAEGAKVKEASKDYGEALTGVASAAKSLAEVRQEVEREIGEQVEAELTPLQNEIQPLQERAAELLEELEEAYDDYVEGAKEYRASLK